MNPIEQQKLIQSINEALQKPPTGSAFHLFALTKQYFVKAQLQYFPQKGCAVESINVNEINKKLRSYHEFRGTIDQFQPVSAQTSMRELESIVTYINQEQIIRFNPENVDIDDLNRQVQAYAKYQGITIDAFATDIDEYKLAQDIQKINYKKPMVIPTLAKLNQQIETFCLYKDKTEDEKMSLKLSDQNTLGEAEEKIQAIHQENQNHYDAYQDFFKFTNEYMPKVIGEYLDEQDQKVQAQKINQLSSISRFLIKLGEYNVSTAIMMKVLEILSIGPAKERLQGLISQQTKSDIDQFNQISLKIFQRYAFYSERKTAIPRIELVEKTEETFSGFLGNIGGNNSCIQNLEMLKSEMEQKKTSEPNRSSIFFENLPANIRKELDDIHLFELINREKQKFDASMLASANKLIQNYRKMISGLSYASHLDLLKELLMNPVKDYVSHFDEKGVGGAGLFSRLSPTTLKKKQAANELIDNISRSTEIEHLENILRDLPIPEQLSSISKKQPQLIVIRDELLCVLSEYKQSILEPKLDMTSSSVATSVTTLFWNAPDSISRESRKGLIEP